jgi:hypothetical protein
VAGTVKFGGGSIMMWGCMTSKGIGFSCRIDGRMDAELYTNILSDELNQTLKYYDLEPSEIIFQQDNDPNGTLPREQRNGSKSMKSRFSHGPHKVLTSIQSNICGNT